MKTIEGAACTACFLEERYGVQAIFVGTSRLPIYDQWRLNLDQAKDTLFCLATAVEHSILTRSLTVIAANTCSVSLATLPVVASQYPDITLLWIDAHGDFNTPTTTISGYLGGMVLAAACGLWDSGHGAGLRAKQVILVGARDIDEAESELLLGAGVRIIAPEDAAPQTILAAVGQTDLWIHIDWDVLEPGYVQADYEVPGGLLPTQLQSILDALPHKQIRGVELAEFHLPDSQSAIKNALSMIDSIIAPILNKPANRSM